MIKIITESRFLYDPDFITYLYRFNFILNKEANKACEILFDDFRDFSYDFNNYYDTISNWLHKYGLSIFQIDEKIMVEDWLEDFYEARNHDSVRIYPEDGGLGWILNLNTGEVEYLEGTTEPLTDLDILFNDAFTPEKYITLYSMQDYNFVESWKIKGIPINTYFSDSKNFALHHWHTTGNDVLISIELWNKDLRRESDQEYNNIKPNNKNFKKLRYL